MSCSSCMGTIIHGAIGLAKAGLQAAGIPIDQTPDDEAKARLEACRGCPELTRNPSPRFAAGKGLTSSSRCQLCTCFVIAKVGIKSETCPLDKWPAPEKSS